MSQPAASLQPGLAAAGWQDVEEGDRITLHSANRTVSYELVQKVEAYESATTPAGTFKAFRVSSSDTLGNENVDWISTELGIFVKRSFRRTEKHAQGPGTRDMQVISISMTK